MRRLHWSLTGLAVSFLLYPLQAQFVAFNDHDNEGRIAHPFTTRYSLDYFSQSNFVQGPLRDITDGSFLPVQLRIEGSVSYSSTPTTNFASGTPASTIFGGPEATPYIVDFRGSSSILGGTNVYTFTGLKPARKYQFIGTANLVLPPPYDSSRTLYGIHGVDSFSSAHTANCVTQYSSFIASNEVAMLLARNAEPGFGDMVVWNDIRPGTDGSFYITVSRFLSDYPAAAPFGGFRLVEDFVDPTSPFITSQPKDIHASRASAQSLAPIVEGSLPLAFQWFKDGNLLPSGTNRILRFNSLQPEDAGIYWLVTTNPYGAITTTNVTVTVSNHPIGIASQPQNRSLRYGELLSLSVIATGTPPHFFQWFRSGFPLSDATNSSFIIAAANVQHSGSYSVSVSNLFSSALSSTAVVSVIAQPVRILEQPQSQTVTQGTALLLQVAVSGSAQYFEWFRNGAVVGGSSVYRVTAATTNHAGNYQVVASGPLNSVTSTVAAVTVVPPPPPPPPPPGLFALLPLTNVWAYDQSANDLGTAWREVNYDDSAWLSGPGVHAIETLQAVTRLTNTVLRLANDAGQPVITSYFRTHFSWPTSSIGAALLFSNVIDDGAIFYLNGVPLFQYNMPAGVITSSTLAPFANPAGEGVFLITNVAAPMIVEGDNVLAVEVHQNSATSSDIVFGTAIFGYNLPDVPLSIVSSPRSQTVLEGQPLELNFQVNGRGRFQWYHDGVPVNSPPGPSFVVASVKPSDAGEYFAVATNSLGAVTSAVAVVEVIADTQPPRVLTAILGTNRTTIVVQLNEPVLASTASNTANYHLFFSDGSEAAAVVSASYSNQQVSLSLQAAPPPGTNLLLELDGVTDRAVASNRTDAMLVPVRQHVLLVPLTGEWKYNDTGADLGTAWREPAYDDSPWPGGPALLYNDNAYASGDIFPPPPPPLLVTNTWIQLTNEGRAIVTHYFRRHIVVTEVSPLGAQVALNTMIDDGAVIYWNGSEFFRLGITNDPVLATSLAARGRGAAVEGTVEGPFVATPSRVDSGSNVLAVEVHQLALVDVSFGAEVSLLAKSFTNEPVRILRQPADVTVREGEPFTFEVESIAAASAQWHKNGGADPVPGANAETLTVARATASDHGALFHIALSNAFGFTVSRRATLHVIPDTNPPVLLSAMAGQSLTQLVLSFSEPLDPASATNLAQYTVRDASGQPIVILSATLANESNVVLTTAPRAAGHNYSVRVAGLRDTAAASNEVEPGGGAMLGYAQVLVPLTATWAYDQSGNGHVDAWKHVGFDDTDWPRGQALLYNDTFLNGSPAVTPGALLSLTNPLGGWVVTHYFRHAFHLPPLQPGTALSLRHAVDDGVVIYLNGTAIERRGLPAGPISVSSLANVTVDDPVLTGSVPVIWSGLSGEAVLAAETHQAAVTSSDVGFAAELSIVRPSNILPAIGPTLRLERVGPQLRLSWIGSQYILESTSEVDGDWLPVSQANPLLIPLPEGNRFYRLRKP